MDKIKEKLKNKKTENLIFFLIILVITLVIINKILNDDKQIEEEKDDYYNAELAQDSDIVENDLEKRLANILSQIDGVSDVSVLITYSESSQIVPIYDEKNNKSTTEEKDTSGGTRIIESEENEKSVITSSDSSVIIQKTVNPIIEGAIITASGVENSLIKSNIISAVEAVTGLASHKIQVFETGN